MPLEVDQPTWEFIRDHRVARLATAGVDGRPAVVPICYVAADGLIFTPIDEKPKSVEAADLKRARNIEANPRVALLIDDYSEDWSKLIYVLVSGTAEIVMPDSGDPQHARAVELLREKYPQYRSMRIDRRPVIRITPARIKRWAPAEHAENA